MKFSGKKCWLLFSVCCMLIIHTFTVSAQVDMAPDSYKFSVEEENLIPVEKGQSYSMYDLFKNSMSFVNEKSPQQFSELGQMTHDQLTYDVNMLDVDINARRRRAVNDQVVGSGTVDECKDSSLNNCSGQHVQCIELDDGYECGCDESYTWNPKDRACYKDLYPHGTAANAISLPKTDDASKKLVVSSGIPFYQTKQTKIYIGTNGIVSFGRKFNPTEIDFPPEGKRVLCPYCSDVDTSVSDNADISYRFYDKNSPSDDVIPVFKKANADVVMYSSVESFDASQVLVITWYKVPKYGSKNPNTEVATFQVVIVTDGETTYAMYIYNELNWKPSMEPIIIGYAENTEKKLISVSGTRGAYSLRTIGGVKGETGFYIFRVGYVQSFSQKCMNWYQSQLREYQYNVNSYNRLPSCPCSINRLRSDRRWRRIFGRTRGVRCTNLNYISDFLPKGKKCCYRNGRFISRGSNAGYAIRYNEYYNWMKYFLADVRGKYSCCVKSNNCDKFYSIRPTGRCSSTSRFRQGGGFGDPHIATLDGNTFIFNGHGEYTLILIKEGDYTFDLQARTGRAVTSNGTETTATIFTAFAAKENTKSRFHVELSPDKSKMYVFGNDEAGDMKDYTQLFNNNDPTDEKSFITDPTLSSLTITKSLEGDVTVAFPSGNSLTVKLGPKLLTIDASIHIKYKTNTKGLLGNFDGDKTNDLIFPDGTVLTSTSEEAMFHYAQKWMITPEKSVLMYPARENANDYNFPDFTPMFLDQADPALRAKANTVCGGEANIACVFDFVATGNEELASATNVKKAEADETQAELSNSIPVIESSSTHLLNVTKDRAEVAFQLSGTDADNDVLVYQFTGETPEGVTLVLDRKTGAGSIKTTSMDAMSLRFLVNDTKYVVSSEHQINVLLCDGCSGHGDCVFSESRSSPDSVSTNDAFSVVSCDCQTGWSGDDCSVDYDACGEKPCITGQDCTDLTPEQEGALNRGYNCSACPTGFEEKNEKCADIDECETAMVCPEHATCENTAGSYHCVCKLGFKAYEKTCEDINECETGSHDCDQYCANTVGSFTCSCRIGFKLNTDLKTCTKEDVSKDCKILAEKDCAYDCYDRATHWACFCKSGYTLNNDGISCDNVNECDQNICSQKCADNDGSYVCSCYNGYKLAADKRSCEACTDLSYGPDCGLTCDCGDRASKCDRVLGCICNAGWTGTKCDENINECQVDPSICGSNMLCMDTDGSYVCNCPAGFEKDGPKSCIDINECDGEANTCVQECTNVAGSFSCSCRPGFQGENCTDVDECEADQHDCEQICSNVVGSFDCKCQFGYRLKEDRKSCEKVKDVCTLFPDLHCAHGCSVDEKHQAYCFCKTGFRLASDDETCLDIDECTTTDENLKHKCNKTCINTESGYKCSCPIGFKLQNDRLSCKACDSSHWGDNCVNPCDCGIGSSSCNSETGCVCKTGWQGIHCNEDINECNGVITCPTNSVCDNTPGSYRCKCNDGYRMSSDKVTCDNIDECTEKLHDCDQICTDNPGSFVCSCNPGFVWTESTKECKDIDECKTGSDECDHFCVNSVGGYDCSCRSGFNLNIDQKSCKARDFCVRSDCDSTNGGCYVDNHVDFCFCNKGFSLRVSDNKTCDDIKECDASPSPCSDNGVCEEKTGSYACKCKNGYKLQTDGVSCRECVEGTYGSECAQTCSCSSSNTVTCNKENGTCTCKEGWSGDDCTVDINECTRTSNPVECGDHGICRNLNGSYICGCDDGFFRMNEKCTACDDKHWGSNCVQTCTCTIHAASCNATDGSCTCKTGWEGTNCETDIDECSVNTTICSGTANSVCKNNDGSYSCDCKSGYTKISNGTCQDVDECLEGTHNCKSEENKKCFNLVGSFKCDCKPGSIPSGTNSCTECDKIHWGINCSNNCMCTDNAVSCNSADGSCLCKTGWEGDTCEKDINECKVNTAICSGIPNTECVNSLGSYSCDCKSGYTTKTDGACEDINECLTVSHGCEQQCLNEVGGYKCYCSAGYVISPKDGKQCDAIKRFAAVVVLDYKLKNTDSKSAEYIKQEKEIEEALTNYFKNVIKGFIKILIKSLKRGSTVAEYDIVVNSEVEKDPEGSVTKAMINLEKNGTIMGSILILSQKLQNTSITNDTTLCSLYRDMGNCPDVQRCEVVNGFPVCSEVKSDDNLQLIIGLSVGIPLFFIVMAAIVFIVYMCFKSKRSHNGDDSSSDHDPTYQDQPFRSVFASSLPRRSHFGQSNLGYNPDTAPYDSWGKRNKSPNGKKEQMDFYSGPQRDDNRRNFSWDFLMNTLPQEPFEIKRPKISASPNPASPSFKRTARHNEAFS